MISLKNQYAYIKEQLFITIFLMVVLYTFFSLWGVVFKQEGASLIEGFSLREMLWYLLFTESIVLSQKNVSLVIEEEVQSGDLATRLTRPVSYVFFHFAQFLGESLFSFIVILSVGGFFLSLLAGPISVEPLSLIPLFIIFLTTQFLHFLYFFMIGILSFWVEEITGPFFIFDKLKWILGGFFMPLEVFPESVKRIALALPFKDMLYFPAKLGVQFAANDFWSLLERQLIWGILFLIVAFSLLKIGERRVSLNGG
jgi:ABC-2 type transport system permease protein